MSIISDIIIAVERTSFAKLLNITNEQLIFVLIFSFIIGAFCLTFYYYLFDKKENAWKNLGNFEKVIFCIFIGFLSLLTSVIFVAITECLLGIFLKDYSSIPKISNTLLALFPFLYFFIITTNIQRKSDLSFVYKFAEHSIKASIIGIILFLIFFMLLVSKLSHGIIA